jgi:PII-like signaling protein
MQGLCLTIYIQEFRKHKGILLYEWLLEKAKSIGIKGGTAFRGMRGFGRKGILYEEHFYQLASNLPIKLMFILEP